MIMIESMIMTMIILAMKHRWVVEKRKYSNCRERGGKIQAESYRIL
jgi:hypothetical protein